MRPARDKEWAGSRSNVNDEDSLDNKLSCKQRVSVVDELDPQDPLPPHAPVLCLIPATPFDGLLMFSLLLEFREGHGRAVGLQALE
jgi:hypothetical protein